MSITPENPLYIEQIELRPYYGFMFRLPSVETGRSDVEIYVEYGANQTLRTIVYNAWAQVGAAPNMRALVHTGSVAPGEDYIERIVHQINASDSFRDELAGFLDYIADHEHNEN